MSSVPNGELFPEANHLFTITTSGFFLEGSTQDIRERQWWLCDPLSTWRWYLLRRYIFTLATAFPTVQLGDLPGDEPQPEIDYQRLAMIEEWNANVRGQVMAAVRADLEEAERRCWGNFEMVQAYHSRSSQETVGILERPEQAQVNPQFPELGIPSIDSPSARQQFALNTAPLETGIARLDLNSGMDSSYQEFLTSMDPLPDDVVSPMHLPRATMMVEDTPTGMQRFEVDYMEESTSGVFDISIDNSLSESMAHYAPDTGTPQPDRNYDTSAVLDELEMSCRELLDSLSPVSGQVTVPMQDFSMEMENPELDDFENHYMEESAMGPFDISSSSVMECAPVSDTFQQGADFDSTTALDELERSCREMLESLPPPPDTGVAPMQDLSIDMSVQHTATPEIQERPRDFFDDLFDDHPSPSVSQSTPGTATSQISGYFDSTAVLDELETSCRELNGPLHSPVPDAVTASIPNLPAGMTAGYAATSDEHHLEHNDSINRPRDFLDDLFDDPPSQAAETVTPGELERSCREFIEAMVASTVTPSRLENVRRELIGLGTAAGPSGTESDLPLTIAPSATILAPASSPSPAPESSTAGEAEVTEVVEVPRTSEKAEKSVSRIPKRYFRCLWGDASEAPCGELVGTHWSNDDFLAHLELFHQYVLVGGERTTAKVCKWRLESGRMCGAQLRSDGARWNVWKQHIQKRLKHAWVSPKQVITVAHVPTAPTGPSPAVRSAVTTRPTRRRPRPEVVEDEMASVCRLQGAGIFYRCMWGDTGNLCNEMIGSDWGDAQFIEHIKEFHKFDEKNPGRCKWRLFDSESGDILKMDMCDVEFLYGMEKTVWSKHILPTWSHAMKGC